MELFDLSLNWEGEGSEVFKGLFVNYHNKESLKATISPYFGILSLATYNEFEADDSLLLIALGKNSLKLFFL